MAETDYTALVNQIGNMAEQVGSGVSSIATYYAQSKAIDQALAVGGDAVTQLNRKKTLLENTIKAVEEYIKQTEGRDPALEKNVKTIATVGAIGVGAFALIYLGKKRRKR